MMCVSWDWFTANLWCSCRNTRRRSLSVALDTVKGKGKKDEGWGGWEAQKSWTKWDEGGKIERVKERGSAQVMDTERERERGEWREKRGGDLSLEDMSNSHATGSNAWESRQLLAGLTTASLLIAYSARIQQNNQPVLSCRGSGSWRSLSWLPGSCSGQNAKYYFFQITVTAANWLYLEGNI